MYSLFGYICKVLAATVSPVCDVNCVCQPLESWKVPKKQVPRERAALMVLGTALSQIWSTSVSDIVFHCLLFPLTLKFVSALNYYVSVPLVAFPSSPLVQASGSRVVIGMQSSKVQDWGQLDSLH